jgi:hypothetical protein
LFGVMFFSLHTLSYYTIIPFCNYLYAQNVSCATSTLGLAIWPGDEYILGFLFAVELWFQQTNKAKQ